MFNVPHGGETIVIRNKKKAILYEAGEGHDDENSELARKIRRFLKGKGAKLRAIVSSHNHQDHSNAIGSLVNGDKSIFRNDIEFFHQKEPRDSDFHTSMMCSITAAGIPKKGLDPWDRVKINNWNENQSISLFCGPIAGKKSSRFYRSVLMLLPFENSKFLFTGDIDSSPTENQIRVNSKTKNIIKNIDFLQITHHGSNSGTNKKFLNHINGAIFASSSLKEKGGHDFDPKTKNRIESFIKSKENFETETSPIFDTSKVGEIVVRTDGKNITWDGVTGKLFEIQLSK